MKLITKKKFVLSVYTSLAMLFIVQACRGDGNLPSDPPNNLRSPIMAAGYSIQPMSYDEVQPAGIMADRIELSLNKLIKDKKKHTPFIGWGADQIGRWIGAVAVEAAILGRDEQAHLQPKVDEMITNQAESGLYFGDQMPADAKPRMPWPNHYMMMWFGQGRAIWNLFEHYNLTGDEKSWDSLLKAADFAVANREYTPKMWPDWGRTDKSWGIGCGIESCLGAMAVLGQKTGKQDYLDYARYMADNSPKELGGQLHSYLSITHGLVDLAMATGEKKYLDQAIKIYHATLPYLWINGVVPEHVGVFEHRDESCALVDWILLLSKLYDATGEAHYLDTLEFCTVNGLLFNQHNNGGFVTYRSVDRHKWMSDHNRGVDHDHCCTMHGGIGITYATAHIVTQSAEGLSVNLPLGADVSLKQNGKDVKLSQKIDVKPTVLVQKIHIKNSGKKPLSIKVRVPYWCDSPALQVDGKKQPLKIKDGFINLSCKGKSEQNIEMTLPMKLVVIPARKNILTLDTAGAPGKAVEEGLQYGPYALMFFREMYKEVKERHLSVTVPLENGRPIMSQKLPEGWRAAGSVPLLIKAKLGNGADVWLTPGANSTMMQFSVVDPYVFRFAKVTVSK